MVAGCELKDRELQRESLERDFVITNRILFAVNSA